MGRKPTATEGKGRCECQLLTTTRDGMGSEHKPGTPQRVGRLDKHTHAHTHTIYLLLVRKPSDSQCTGSGKLQVKGREQSHRVDMVRNKQHPLMKSEPGAQAPDGRW